MVATGKTLDLFEWEADREQRPRERAQRATRLTLIPPGPPPNASKDTARELWLAVHVPQLPLLAVHGAAADRSDTPWAVAVQEGNRQRVIACNAAAAVAGVQPGMSLKAAYALQAHLQTVARDEAAERRLLESLAERAHRFTPRVCIEAPDALLLEVRASLKLFGGLRRLVEAARSEFAGQGVEACLSVAPAPLSALALARAGKRVIVAAQARLASQVGALPIDALAAVGGNAFDEALQTLRDAGVELIGQCARLPRAGLAKRFGPQFVELLDRVLGRAPQPTRTHVPRERFSQRREFETEIEDHERLKRQVQPLLTELATFLRARDATIQAFELALFHRDAPPLRLRIRFVTPTRDGGHFMAVLAERLERVRLAAPVRSAHLRSAPLLPPDAMYLEAAAEQTLLQEKAARAAAAMPRLIERLQARLGAEAVYGVRPVPEHRPEKAWKRERGLCTRKPAGARRGRAGYEFAAAPAARRPFWLLSEPQALHGVRGRPCHEGELEIESGPERLESGWWDGADVSRDYYVARTPAGLRVWIYRERGRARWWLHGLFG